MTVKPDPETVPREIIYCPKCHCLHVDLHEWAHRPHMEHLCERCGETFQLDHYSFGVNLPPTPLEDRVPHKCWLCQTLYRTRGSIEEGQTPVRNVCVCETTKTCSVCGHGFVVQRDLFDEAEEPTYRCRGCAQGVIDPVMAPVARTGRADLADLDEHFEYFVKRDKRRFLCEGCRKNHVASKSTVEKTPTGYLFGCPGCGDNELVLTIPVTEPVTEVKKPSVHWRRRTRRPASTESNEGDE